EDAVDRQGAHGSLAERLEALCRATAGAKAAAQGVHLTLRLEEVDVDEETAWTVCVVASELMTNAFKHAFAAGLPGTVGVGLFRDGEAVTLSVSDNGVGSGAAPADTVWRAPGFGAGIVTGLAEHLGGFATRVSGPAGTTATLRVPARGGLQ